MSYVKEKTIKMQTYAKETKNKELENICLKILNAYEENDGTPGLWDFLWEEIIYPSFVKASALYEQTKHLEYQKTRYQENTLATTVLAAVLGKRRKNGGACNGKRKRT